MVTEEKVRDVREFKEIKQQVVLYPELERKSKEDLKGEKITFLEVTDYEGNFGPWVVAKIIAGKKEYSFTVGSTLAKQLITHREQLPFMATLTEKKSSTGRYYWTLE